MKFFIGMFIFLFSVSLYSYEREDLIKNPFLVFDSAMNGNIEDASSICSISYVYGYRVINLKKPYNVLKELTDDELFKICKIASRGKDLDSKRVYAFMLLDRSKRKSDMDIGFNILKETSNNGDINSYSKLASLYDYHKKNPKKSEYWYLKAINEPELKNERGINMCNLSSLYFIDFNSPLFSFYKADKYIENGLIESKKSFTKDYSINYCKKIKNFYIQSKNHYDRKNTDGMENDKYDTTNNFKGF